MSLAPWGLSLPGPPSATAAWHTLPSPGCVRFISCCLSRLSISLHLHPSHRLLTWTVTWPLPGFSASRCCSFNPFSNSNQSAFFKGKSGHHHLFRTLHWVTTGFRTKPGDQAPRDLASNPSSGLWLSSTPLPLPHVHVLASLVYLQDPLFFLKSGLLCILFSLDDICSCHTPFTWILNLSVWVSFSSPPIPLPGWDPQPSAPMRPYLLVTALATLHGDCFLSCLSSPPAVTPSSQGPCLLCSP